MEKGDGAGESEERRQCWRERIFAVLRMTNRKERQGDRKSEG